MGIKIYIISLKNSIRREFQIAQMGNLNLPFSFYDAVEGKCLDSEFLSSHRADWERPMKNNEFACYLSHLRLWKIIFDNNEPALILEDDALLSKKINKILPKLLHIQNVDYINLENRGRKKIVSKKRIAIAGNYFTRKLFHDTTGAAGYILWPSGAKKLLRNHRKYGCALADAKISNCYDLTRIQVDPAPIVQLDMHQIYNFLIPDKYQTAKKSSVSSSDRLITTFRQRIRRIIRQLFIGLKKIILFPFCSNRFLDSDLKYFKIDF